MRKYLVENVSDEMQHFAGHALGKPRGGRKGGSIWLVESDFNSHAVQARINMGDLELLKIVPPLESQKDVSTKESHEPIKPQKSLADIRKEAEKGVIDKTPEPIDYSSLKFDELKALVKARELTTKGLRKKTDYIKLLEESDED